jgi:hypothetical protein
MPDRDPTITETPDLSIMDEQNHDPAVRETQTPPVRPAEAAAPNGAQPPADGEAPTPPEEQVLHDGEQRSEPQRGLSPGDVAAEKVPDLWPEPEIGALRERWREVQLHFVDDPRAATEEADTIVVDAVKTLTSALNDRRTNLADRRSDGGDETERLRVTVQRYRDFLDRVLAL